MKILKTMIRIFHHIIFKMPFVLSLIFKLHCSRYWLTLKENYLCNKYFCEKFIKNSLKTILPTPKGIRLMQQKRWWLSGSRISFYINKKDSYQIGILSYQISTKGLNMGRAAPAGRQVLEGFIFTLQLILFIVNIFIFSPISQMTYICYCVA